MSHQYRRFASADREGLVALFILLVGCAIILYGTGCQQTSSSTGSETDSVAQGSESGKQKGQSSKVSNQNSGSETQKKSVSTDSKANNGDPATFLGKPSTDPEIQEYIIQNNCELTGLSRRCFRSGVELGFDTGGRVSGMIYYVAGNNLYRPYEGPLPGGLSASDTKADIDRKLGPPQNTGPDWAAYPPQISGTISLFIEFAPRGGPLALNSSIQEMSFRKGDAATQRAAEALLE